MFQSMILHWLDKAPVTKEALTAYPITKDKQRFQKLRHIRIVNLIFITSNRTFIF